MQVHFHSWIICVFFSRDKGNSTILSYTPYNPLCFGYILFLHELCTYEAITLWHDTLDLCSMIKYYGFFGSNTLKHRYVCLDNSLFSLISLLLSLSDEATLLLYVEN